MLWYITVATTVPGVLNAGSQRLSRYWQLSSMYLTGKIPARNTSLSKLAGGGSLVAAGVGSLVAVSVRAMTAVSSLVAAAVGLGDVEVTDGCPAQAAITNKEISVGKTLSLTDTIADYPPFDSF
jgi:hypothetical protein